MKIGLQHAGAGKIWANHYYGLPSEPSLNRSNFLPGGPILQCTATYTTRVRNKNAHGTQSESPAQQVDVHQILPGSLGTHLGRFVSLAAEVPPP
jgi:hypothetical protein